jgi:hypothetical protein
MITLRPKWWQWPTVLSLDAPVVAMLWQGLFAASIRAPLRFAPVFVLGTSVWLAYAADRWIEGWRLHPEAVRTQRHYFYQRGRWPLAALWLAMLAGDLAAATSGLSRREFLAGLVLLGAVVAYLLSHQLVHRHHPGRAPKEVCVALLLAGGVAVFIVAPELERALRVAGLLALFGLLCFANCALISVWEDAVDQSHGQTSFARQFRRGRALSRAVPWLAAALAGALCLSLSGPARTAAACGLASSLLLAAVDRAERRIGRERARVLADVALMTPLLPLAAALWT